MIYKFVKSITMGMAQIRQQLHSYIDSAEEKKLKAIYTLLEAELTDDYKLTEEQKAELDQRFENHQNGLGRTYTWEETVAMARQAATEAIITK